MHEQLQAGGGLELLVAGRPHVADDRVGDVGRAHGAEQAAGVAGLGRHGDRGGLEAALELLGLLETMRNPSTDPASFSTIRHSARPDSSELPMTRTCPVAAA